MFSTLVSYSLSVQHLIVCETHMVLSISVAATPDLVRYNLVACSTQDLEHKLSEYTDGQLCFKESSDPDCGTHCSPVHMRGYRGRTASMRRNRTLVHNPTNNVHLYAVLLRST